MDGEVTVHRRGHIRLRGFARISRAPSAAFRLAHAVSTRREAARLGRFDVVEAPDYVAEGLGLAFRGRTPLVCHLHGPRHLLLRAAGETFDWNARSASGLERFAIRRADVVTSPSKLLVRMLESDGWLVSNQVTVVRNPLDVEAWRDVSSVTETSPVVLSVGRLDATKAPEVLVEAAATLALAVPELELVFVGSSSGARDGLPYGTWVQRRARELGVRARFVGRTTRDALVGFLGQARVMALCSRFDTFPTVALEALASARPVVCTTATGTAELLAGSKAGGVVPVDDPEATAQVLLPFLDDLSTAAAAGAEARELVVRECAPAQVAAQREACYENAIARH
jgi:glycosyltransferase involved in cell wall biosynthesis